MGEVILLIEYGAKVVDVNEEVLGTVDHLINDPGTGELRKFVVRRKAPEQDILISPDSVRHSTASQVELDVSLGELLLQS